MYNLLYIVYSPLYSLSTVQAPFLICMCTFLHRTYLYFFRTRQWLLLSITLITWMSVGHHHGKWFKLSMNNRRLQKKLWSGMNKKTQFSSACNNRLQNMNHGKDDRTLLSLSNVRISPLPPRWIQHAAYKQLSPKAPPSHWTDGTSLLSEFVKHLMRFVPNFARPGALNRKLRNDRPTQLVLWLNRKTLLALLLKECPMSSAFLALLGSKGWCILYVDDCHNQVQICTTTGTWTWV